jgi:hypothetical protein
MSEVIARYTSDHVWRGIEVATKSSTWKGITWNILKKCWNRASRNKRAANNPLDLCETELEYLSRKTKQFVQLKILINDRKLDFALLQECDSDKNISSDLFNIMLAELDWKRADYQERGLCIIYRKELTLNKMETHLIRNHRYNAFSLKLTNQETQESIILINIHAQYTVDYSKSIPRLMKQMSSWNPKIPIILGGDMNHPPGFEFSDAYASGMNVSGQFLVLDDYCTNFMTDYEKHNSGYTKVYLEDERKSVLKNYDGFFISTAESARVFGEEYWDRTTDECGQEHVILRKI